jgi:hypothetical protein
MLRRQRYFGAIVIAVAGLILLVFADSASAQSAFESIDSVKSSKATLELKWDELGTLRKSAAYIKRLTPFYSWLTLCNVVDGADSAFLLGDCLYVQSRWILRLPPDRFRDQYKHTINSLWSRNELDAMTFADATLGQSSSEIVEKNFVSLMQLCALGIGIFLLIRRFGFSQFANAGRLRLRGRLPKYALASAIVWLVGGAVIQIAILNLGPSALLLNLHELVVTGFGTLTILLAVISLAMPLRGSE